MPASSTTKKYADLQIDLTGGEGWGYTNLPGEEAGEFAGDIGFRTSPDAVSGVLGEGRFVLFFPGELHKPGVARPGCDSCAQSSHQDQDGGLMDMEKEKLFEQIKAGLSSPVRPLRRSLFTPKRAESCL